MSESVGILSKHPFRAHPFYRAHGALLQGRRVSVGAGHARESANTGNNRPGHQALRRGRFSIPGGIYLVTTTTDQRVPLFADFWTGVAVSGCFTDARLLGDTRMLAWVLMPDHVHWMLELGTQTGLSDMLNRLKSASARRVNRHLERKGAVWARAFFDRALRKEDDLKGMARYVIANPVRAGLVERLGDYPFWDAVWL